MQQQQPPQNGYQQQWNAGAWQGGGADKIGRNLITNSKFETYLSNSPHNNQYAMLADMDNDGTTIVANNRSKDKQLAYKAASPIQISLNLGIADAGATEHFLQPGAPVINIRRTKIQLASANQMGVSSNQLTSVKSTTHYSWKQQERHTLSQALHTHHWCQ